MKAKVTGLAQARLVWADVPSKLQPSRFRPRGDDELWQKTSKTNEKAFMRMRVHSYERDSSACTSQKHKTRQHGRRETSRKEISRGLHRLATWVVNKKPKHLLIKQLIEHAVKEAGPPRAEGGRRGSLWGPCRAYRSARWWCVCAAPLSCQAPPGCPPARNVVRPAHLFTHTGVQHVCAHTHRYPAHLYTHTGAQCTRTHTQAFSTTIPIYRP